MLVIPYCIRHKTMDIAYTRDNGRFHMPIKLEDVLKKKRKIIEFIVDETRLKVESEYI